MKIIVHFAAAVCSLAFLTFGANADEIGKFTLNGETLYIPRDYLWQGKNDPDGPAKDDALYLLLKYPSLEPASLNEDQADVVKVTITSGGQTAEDEVLGKPVTIHAYQSMYYATTMMKNPNSPESERTPIFIRKLRFADLDQYEIPVTSYRQDVFVKGDVLAPEEWVICRLGRCRTSINITSNIDIDVSYRRWPYFERYNQLHPAIIKKIQSFIVK